MYSDFRQLFSDIKANWNVIADHYQYARNKFFYQEDFISLLLFNRTHDKLPKTSYIDYNLVFDYYDKNRKKLNLSYNNSEKTLELPYQEVINFIDHPNAVINVKGEIGHYHLPEEIESNTQNAFNTFLAERPHTTDDPKVRMVNFHKHSDQTYSTKLEISSYFDAVHTSLSLDYPMDDDFLQTLRLKDLDDNNQLRPLSESILDNHIGVFSTIAFKSNGYWYFHMMPRNKGLGVYNSMLSSVSGSVDPSDRPITELVSYATQEIKRETQEEIGLDIEALEQANRAQVVPLAFTRELARGGQPQFFFVTILEEVTDQELKQAFKQAPWKNEFRSDMFSNITSLDDVVSPEFSTALLYTYEYFQKRRKLPTDTLFLS